MSSDLPLPQFYAQTLSSLGPILDDTLSTSLSTTQATLSTALDNLHLIARMITSLGVFSDNEGVEELGDGELRFMTLGWVIGESEGRGGLNGREDRMAALKRAENAFNQYISLCLAYGILSETERKESESLAEGSKGPQDPASRREAKIRQYKREKELRESISNGTPSRPASSSHPIEFLLALLPSATATSASSASSSTSVNGDPSSSSSLRSTTLLLLRLLFTLTLSSLSSINMELELLASAPASISTIPELDDRGRDKGEEDDTWKLDIDGVPGRRHQPRELISGGGRVLRPFTILPSTSRMTDRERLNGEVFRESWRLPTMTIDEYLQEEQRRGNIITGGGQASQDAPTASELLALAAEDDGTLLGDEKEEAKRLKDENWARFTEENKKGAGNTMNRG